MNIQTVGFLSFQKLFCSASVAVADVISALAEYFYVWINKQSFPLFYTLFVKYKSNQQSAHKKEGMATKKQQQQQPKKTRQCKHFTQYASQFIQYLLCILHINIAILMFCAIRYSVRSL